MEEWAEFYGGKDKMITIWNDAVKERFNYLYLKLDDVQPRAFQIGSLGLFKYDIATETEDPDNLLTEEVETEPPEDGSFL